MPIAVTPEQLAITESIAQWAKRAGTIGAVRAREGVLARGDHLPGLPAAQLGVFGVGLPEQAGGAGGTTEDVAVVAEQLATVLASGAVLTTLLAGLVLARQREPADSAGQGSAGELLAGIAAGTRTVAAALVPPDGLEASRRPGGGLRVRGTAGLVLGAGETTDLLLGAFTESGPIWFWQPATAAGVTITARSPVDFSRALADVHLRDTDVAPEQLLDAGPRLVPDLAAMLAAAEGAGIATWCSQTATDYARTRQQFGRPIGSFQAVKHLCAQMLCRAELASAAAWDAARSADQPDELGLAAAAAAAVALDSAVDNAKDCIQVLGGIGFTWEHDAHLYLRRALALRSLAGGSGSWRARTASLSLAGARRHRLGRRQAGGGEAAGGQTDPRGCAPRRQRRVGDTARSLA